MNFNLKDTILIESSLPLDWNVEQQEKHILNSMEIS